MSWRRASGIAFVVASLVGCGPDTEADTGVVRADGLVAALAGPQGRVPQLIVECPFSHSSFDDPIVHPGHNGASHLHHFFGNTSTDSDSSYESLTSAGTTCNDQKDTAAYWTPALLDDGREVRPVAAVAYYRPGIDTDSASLQAFPPDLRMISDLTAWACGGGSVRSTSPPECTRRHPLHLVVVFPDCWNGTDLDTPDHRRHLGYSVGGRCPTSHPVGIPQLTFSVEYPIDGPDHQLTLSSGDVATAHGDFINSWDQEKLETDIELCLARDVVCGVSH